MTSRYGAPMNTTLVTANMALSRSQAAADTVLVYGKRCANGATSSSHDGSIRTRQGCSTTRRFLELEDERCGMAIRRGASGLAVEVACCHVLTWLFSTRFVTLAYLHRNITNIERQRALSRSSLLGGYDRGELAPFSDLDLLFIHNGLRTAQVQEVVESMLFIVDAGLTVGHSFRTVKECLSASHSTCTWPQRN